ncbi:MAG: hypothetical protein PVSMB8_15210 [Vulcanimicrobiaceae bacterium]
MPDSISTDELPAALPVPMTVTVRNDDLGINHRGTASRLDETGMVAVLPVKIEPRTVLFANVDLRTINAMARGLLRVRSQRDLGELGYETVGEFVEINDESRKKIDKVLGRDQGEATFKPIHIEPSATSSAMGSSSPFLPGGYRSRVSSADADRFAAEIERPKERRAYYEPAPLRPFAKASPGTKFWNSIGVSAYVAAFLVVVALFPAGRAFELTVFNKVTYIVSRTWYWGTHIGEVKLWENHLQ